VEACPFDAIEMSPEYELASYEKILVWDLEKLLSVGDKYDVHKTGEAWE
jgi:formate hydrogenlyase subunit 6/NADH:ubiquinone oxidoreductase subunit I